MALPAVVVDVRLLVQVVTVLANVVELGSRKGYLLDKLGITGLYL